MTKIEEREEPENREGAKKSSSTYVSHLLRKGKPMRNEKIEHGRLEKRNRRLKSSKTNKE